MNALARARELPLVAALREPRGLLALPESAWDLLIRQAASARMLPRLAERLEREGLLASVPERPAAHLRWAQRRVARHHRAVRHELDRIGFALGDLGLQWILIKGAAYLVTGNAAAAGRTFSDVDILVPRARLDEVEARLKSHGWDMQPQSAYDEHYYRRWMHELPPLEHRHRRSVLDVHHSLLPPRGRWKVATEVIMAAAHPVQDFESAGALSPADLLLHGAAHLFSDGELPHGLRDLSDIDLQLRALLIDEQAAGALMERARETGLERALWLACRYARLLLDTPLPPGLQRTLESTAPPEAVSAAFDAIYLRALLPWHRSLDAADVRLGRFGAYLRGHWLRMPLALLLPHLLRKAASPHPKRGAA
jgi:hypothetical protein